MITKDSSSVIIHDRTNRCFHIFVLDSVSHSLHRERVFFLNDQPATYSFYLLADCVIAVILMLCTVHTSTNTNTLCHQDVNCRATRPHYFTSPMIRVHQISDTCGGDVHDKQ